MQTGVIADTEPRVATNHEEVSAQCNALGVGRQVKGAHAGQFILGEVDIRGLFLVNLERLASVGGVDSLAFSFGPTQNALDVLDVLADAVHAQRLLVFTSILRSGDEIVVPFQVDGKQRFVNHANDANVPCGLRESNGYFFNAGDLGTWWSPSPSGSYPWYRGVYVGRSDVIRDYGGLIRGYSVRCLRDAE
ncbi:fibrobacter succinogenes major paralogous domain-containing protein [Flavobacteriales bacterium]|nr:fibrobacter succinogenes major paralogous domain-containing protein [Flavobacteriales bacterium]